MNINTAPTAPDYAALETLVAKFRDATGIMLIGYAGLGGDPHNNAPKIAQETLALTPATIRDRIAELEKQLAIATAALRQIEEADPEQNRQHADEIANRALGEIGDGAK